MSWATLLTKFGKGAAIASATALLAYLSGTVLPGLEQSGVSALMIALLGTAINGAKLALEKWKSAE